MAAVHGADALQKFEEYDGEIHLLLTDVVMPQMNGHALARRFVEKYPKSRVLYMTGLAGDMVDEATWVHSAGVLAKPFTPDSLVASVRDALDQPTEDSAPL